MTSQQIPGEIRVPLIVAGGKKTGAVFLQRLAAKGTSLLGIKGTVIAESYERTSPFATVVMVVCAHARYAKRQSAQIAEFNQVNEEISIKEIKEGLAPCKS